MDNKVEVYRLLEGLTNTELARRVGITRAHLWQIATGRVNPQVDTADRIAKELGVTLSDLFPRGGGDGISG